MMKTIILFFCTILLYPACSPYFAPDRFYKAPQILEDILQGISIKKEFSVEKKELYMYDSEEIANEINDDFGGFWSDYVGEDGYEMVLTPEYNLFKYKSNYLSLRVSIYGVKGDATGFKNTRIKYNFFDYTKEVNKHLICKRGTL